MGIIWTLENTVHPLLFFHYKKQVACLLSIPKAGHLLICSPYWPSIRPFLEIRSTDFTDSESPAIWPVCWQVQKELLWCAIVWAVAGVIKINDFIMASWTNQSVSLMGVRKTRPHYPSNPSVTMRSRHCSGLAGRDGPHNSLLPSAPKRPCKGHCPCTRYFLHQVLCHWGHPSQLCRVTPPMLMKNWAIVLIMSVASWTALTAIRLSRKPLLRFR